MQRAITDDIIEDVKKEIGHIGNITDILNTGRVLTVNYNPFISTTFEKIQRVEERLGNKYGYEPYIMWQESQLGRYRLGCN